MIALADVPRTVSDLLQRCEVLEEQQQELLQKIAWYEEQLGLLKQQRFGPSREATELLTPSTDPEASDSALNEEDVAPEVPVAPPSKKQRKTRQTLRQNLPVERIDYTLSAAEQICPECQGALHEMSTTTRRELKMIPAQVKVVEHVQHLYACRHCERTGVQTPILKAPMPRPVHAFSLASASAIAYVMEQKYVMGIPLYRQAQQFLRRGVDLSRQTLSHGVISAAHQWLWPLYQKFHEALLTRELLQADETRLQVLQEVGRTADQQSYLWLYRTGGIQQERPLVLYEYQPTREGKHPQKFLAGFHGYLNVDGYAGYHAVEGVTLVGCWAHLRRKFAEVLKALPVAKRKAGTAAEQGFRWCNRLFDIERSLKEVSAEERQARRELLSRPLVEKLMAWALELEPHVLPKSLLGIAVGYAVNQQQYLENFLLDGRVAIHNNRSELSIKPFVIGRKAWLFANTPRGAQASAIIYSLVETAKENGLKPFDYLEYCLEQLPNRDLADPATFATLLPWSEDLPARLHHQPAS